MPCHTPTIINPAGRLGAVPLAGVGVALSVYNTATKLVQVPLLSIATTTVATAKGAQLQQQLQQDQPGGAAAAAAAGDAVSGAASAVLLVAAAVGMVVGGLLLATGPLLASLWGIGPGSPLRGATLDFLMLRALGAPISIVLLVAQVRRGGGEEDGGLGARGWKLVAWCASDCCPVSAPGRHGAGGAMCIVCVTHWWSAGASCVENTGRLDVCGVQSNYPPVAIFELVLHSCLTLRRCLPTAFTLLSA